VNEVAAPKQESVLHVGEISGDLAHPASVCSGSDSGDLDPTRLEIDYEEHEVPNEALPRDPIDGEEVGRSDRRPNAPSTRSSSASAYDPRDRFHSLPGFA
jgi:hypothetical protein